jgi:DNA-binding CsgD family transcriptional regulator
LGVVVKGGRLTAYWPEAARRLEGLIEAATAPERELRRGGTVALPSPKRKLPLSLTVAPVTSDRLSVFTRTRSVVVCISDLEKGGSIPEQTLRELFLLTPAEARVAMALFEGFSPKETAAALGLSIHTVRVHMASIFNKTGTGRQSEFLRLMMRAVGAQP